jgi:hypothetical protein
MWLDITDDRSMLRATSQMALWRWASAGDRQRNTNPRRFPIALGETGTGSGDAGHVIHLACANCGQGISVWCDHLEAVALLAQAIDRAPVPTSTSTMARGESDVRPPLLPQVRPYRRGARRGQ